MSTTNTAEQSGKTVEQKTHWKKNIDSRYISGEDLRASLRGLKPEMTVFIDMNADAETFNMADQKKELKTALWLKDYITGAKVYKPVILNTTNAKFFMNEFKSEFIEDWYGKPVTLWAQPDKRFGFVARFKHYYAPATVTPDEAIAKLSACKTLTELSATYTALSGAEKNLPAVIAKKDELKGVLK